MHVVVEEKRTRIVEILVSTVIVVGIGSQMYSNGLLKMGARVKLKDALAK